MDNNEKFTLNIDDSAFNEYGEFAPQDSAKESEANDASQTQVLDMPEITSNDEPSQETVSPDVKKPKRKRKSKRKSRKKSVITGIVISMIIVVIGFAAAFFMTSVLGDCFGINNDETQVEITIEPDSSITKIAEQLKDNNIIEYPMAFRAYIKYFTDGVSFQFGIKELSPSMSYDELIKALSEYTKSDKVVEIIIPEGYTVHQIATLLEEKAVCSYDDFIAAVSDFDCSEYSFLSSIDDQDLRPFKLEGYLYPDTYQFYLSDKPYNVISTFLNNFKEKYTYDLQKQVKASEYTLDEIITLASIIQAEAPVEQMPTVASVYYNRINNTSDYPKLQSDPTILYAENILKPLNPSQEVLDAYNTYASNGLPVGAINNPGIDAIMAALNPAKTNYYYFVTSEDMSEFYYATTYSEHLANCKKSGIN